MKQYCVAYRDGEPIGYGSYGNCFESVSEYVAEFDDHIMYADATIGYVTEEDLQQISRQLFIQEYKECRKQGFPVRGAIELARMEKQFGFLP